MSKNDIENELINQMGGASDGPPITYMGGKHRYANEIISKFAPHSTYVEPFVGGGAIFFKHSSKNIMVVNDLNSQLINLFRCLQIDLFRTITTITFTSNNLNTNLTSHNPYIRAASYYVLLTSSFNAQIQSGIFDGRSKLMPKSIIARLFLIRDRLARAIILNENGLNVIDKYDSDKTLFYIDPPYMIKQADKYYKIKFDIESHKRLWNKLDTLQGKFVLSYEDSDVLRMILENHNFHHEELIITNTSSRAGRKQSELLIFNYNPLNVQGKLF